MALPPVPAAPTLSEATNGDETQLFLSINGSAWEEVGELDPEDGLTDLPSGDQTTYETTHMQSGRFKEWKKNKRVDGTETDITGNYTIGGDSEELLKQAEDAGDSIGYMIVLKQGDETWYATGRALFYSLRLTNPGGSVRKFTITAKWVTPMAMTKAA